MAAYTLTPEIRAAYAVLWDFKTQFVKAARQILSAADIAAEGPGDGVQKTPRYYTSVNFVPGAATGKKSPVALGDWRYSEYSQFYGVLSILNSVPFETEEKTGTAYLTEAHARQLDDLTAIEQTLFMEHLEPFSQLDGDGQKFLPLLDVQEIVPVEPDERPEAEREVNIAFRRWRIKFQIRPDAWPVAS